MLMGTAEGKGIDFNKVEKKVFIEDMTAEDKARYYKETLGVLFLYF